jgi:hypothetical protein
MSIPEFNLEYQVTAAKLQELERDLAELERDDLNLDPRQILARRNSLSVLIAELKQEILAFELLQSGSLA